MAIEISRRDFIKIAGVVSGSILLAGCVPKPPRPPLIDPGGWEATEGVTRLVENFTERYSFDYNSALLDRLIKQFEIPKEGYPELDINLLQESEIGIDSIYNQPYLQIGFKENGRGVINIGVGYFDQIFVNDRGYLPTAESEIAYISCRTGSALLEGYVLIAVASNLISGWKARGIMDSYYDLVFKDDYAHPEMSPINLYLIPPPEPPSEVIG